MCMCFPHTLQSFAFIPCVDTDNFCVYRLPKQVPSAHHIFSCANKMNAFNNGWSETAPSGC
jgi:hypothetical protein